MRARPGRAFGSAQQSVEHWIWAAGGRRVKVVGMRDEEEVLRPKRVERPALDGLSVAELRGYIGELQAEIARAEAAIGHKEGARGHADSFFRKG